MNAESNWKFLVLCNGHFNYFNDIECHCQWTSCTNTENKRTSPPVSWLHGNILWCCDTFLQIRHDTQCAFRCIISIHTKGTKSSCRILFPWIATARQSTNSTKWHNPCIVHYFKICCSIGSWSQARSIVPQCQGSQGNATNTPRIRLPLTTHTNPNWQYNHCWNSQQQH